jgi:hypothetical protein
MVEKICSALSEQHGQLVAFDDRDHHSSQLDRAHRGDGGEYHGIGVVLVVRRDDVWIGEPAGTSNVSLSRARGKKFRREEGDRGARGFPSYHPGHPCAAPQAQTDIPVAAVQTLIDLFAEVVRSAIQQRSGSLRPVAAAHQAVPTLRRSSIFLRP